ncbi:hypothetical protein GCM10010435_45150 [Winogradskya consettensis]|uniref:Uncharacterized protein n=1 Tax=Winogradskya consettensis TaxID=113560 RepID=A0A919T3E2_9ACTN|nr:hypothetical protein Aco04nite_83540 [Actinoplanes consettensis]
MFARSAADRANPLPPCASLIRPLPASPSWGAAYPPADHSSKTIMPEIRRRAIAPATLSPTAPDPEPVSPIPDPSLSATPTSDPVSPTPDARPRASQPYTGPKPKPLSLTPSPSPSAWPRARLPGLRLPV